MATGIFPPTPTPSIEQRKSVTMCPASNGESSTYQHLVNPRRDPPTPPIEGEGPSLNFSEPVMPQRPRRGRRPASVYPPPLDDPPFVPLRKFTDPTPRQEGTLDVDLDAYSTSTMEYGDEVPELDSRDPTLSFVTTSTADSTTSTPSIGVSYGYKSDEVDGKPQEPRIRMRTGRAYSSAESSMASGAYSYHDTPMYHHPHPPPLPVVPDIQQVGLGITGHQDPSSFTHRPWKRDVMNRLRSDSVSSSITASTSTSETGIASEHALYSGYNFSDSLPWEEESRADPLAVTMVDEGREKILNVEKLEAMGGMDALTDIAINGLSGTTHLLLPECGFHPTLVPLLAVIAPTLVVLDLSYNDLSFLPECLRHSTALEELNLSGNPLRKLPAWVGELSSLRMLVIDGCGLQNMPPILGSLTSLHTLCLRRNRFVSLPSWLSQLERLETLRVDDNPFADQWMPIVAPILASPPPGYEMRPAMPPRSTSNRESLKSAASVTSMSSLSSVHEPVDMLSPSSSAAQSVYQLGPIAEDPPQSAPLPTAFVNLNDQGGPSDRRELRKMRSAGTLFNVEPTPVAPSTSRFATLGSARSTSAMGNYEEPGLEAHLETPRMTASSSSKSGKWGFLRKMSMNRLKADKISSSTNIRTMPVLKHAESDPISTLSRPMLSTANSAATLPTHVGEFGESMPATRGKRRSFLPVDGPPSISVSIPATSPFKTPLEPREPREPLVPSRSEDTVEDLTLTLMESPSIDFESRYKAGLISIKSYLRDLFDLSRPTIEPYGSFEVVGGSDYGTNSPASSSVVLRDSVSDARRQRRPTFEGQVSPTASVDGSAEESGKKFKNDKNKRTKVLREIYETERTYVRGLGELVSIYVKPAAQPLQPSKAHSETVVPLAERKIVFGGVESILTIHKDNLLPALERAVQPLLDGGDDEEGTLSMHTAHLVGEVFRTYIAYMKQYSTYINNFDNALSRMKTWTLSTSAPTTPKPTSPTTVSSAAVSVGMMGAASLPINDTVPHSGLHMTTAQRKRVKTFLKRCRENPKHSQINLESYLLLPIQRVPRYKLLLEDLAMCTPPRVDGPRDTLDDALNEIASLASLMNEEKRDSDSRLRLFHWQKRITSRGPSPLVQPHRKLIMDGALHLIRLVKKASTFVEVDTTSTSVALGLGHGHGHGYANGSGNGNGNGSGSGSGSGSGNGSGDPEAEHTITPSRAVVPIEYIAPEPMDRPMMLILCTDLLVLVQQRNEGWDGAVDLFNVLRMATLREPASIVGANVLRVVDNKSIYYFDGASVSSVTAWCRAINTARRK